MNKILLDMSNFVFLTVHLYSNDCQIDIYIPGSLPRFRFLFSFSYRILISKFTAIITMIKVINNNNYHLFNTYHLTGTHSYFMSTIWFTFPMSSYPSFEMDIHCYFTFNKTLRLRKVNFRNLYLAWRNMYSPPFNEF